MTTISQPKEIIIKDWVFRIKREDSPIEQTRIMLLIHGYMGNEKVMWTLTNPLPGNYIFIAPRAPVKNSPGRYSWHEIGPKWPNLSTYQVLAEQLLDRVDFWCNENDIATTAFDIMGFSQGAVMAYAMAFLFPEKIGRVAALASFIPQSWKPEINADSIEGKSFFIAHGTKDEIIPIKQASQSANWLEDKGANVTFCKAVIGHKLSSDCFKGLGDFFKN